MKKKIFRSVFFILYVQTTDFMASGLGETLRGIDQQQRLAPVTSAQQVVAMLSGLPLGLFAGENQQGTKTETATKKTKGFDLGAEAKFG